MSERRFKQDPKTGEMAGSYALPADPPTPVPKRANPQVKSVFPDGPSPIMQRKARLAAVSAERGEGPSITSVEAGAANRVQTSQPKLLSAAKSRRKAIDLAFAQKDAQGREFRKCKCGIYAFLDYRGEPLYVGQTYENLSGRVGRHLTGQRSDAVNAGVLDPSEVAYIRLWPLWDLKATGVDVTKTLNDLEFTIHEQESKRSRFGAIPTVKHPLGELVDVPDESYFFDILPRGEGGEHSVDPDARISGYVDQLLTMTRNIEKRDGRVSAGLREAVVLQSLKIMEALEARVDAATSGEAAQPEVESNSFDAVLRDGDGTHLVDPDARILRAVQQLEMMARLIEWRNGNVSIDERRAVVRQCEKIKDMSAARFADLKGHEPSLLADETESPDENE